MYPQLGFTPDLLNKIKQLGVTSVGIDHFIPRPSKLQVISARIGILDNLCTLDDLMIQRGIRLLGVIGFSLRDKVPPR